MRSRSRPPLAFVLGPAAVALAACQHTATVPEATATECVVSDTPAPACAGRGPAAEAPGAKSVAGGALALCPARTATGYHRDGYCASDESDRGQHVVCARVTDDFLRFTGSRGNDLVTPRASFPGLRAGDAWCLCASRWFEAYEAGVAPPVLLEATEASALRTIPQAALAERAISAF